MNAECYYRQQTAILRQKLHEAREDRDEAIAAAQFWCRIADNRLEQIRRIEAAKRTQFEHRNQ